MIFCYDFTTRSTQLPCGLLPNKRTEKLGMQPVASNTHGNVSRAGCIVISEDHQGARNSLGPYSILLYFIYSFIYCTFCKINFKKRFHELYLQYWGLEQFFEKTNKQIMEQW